MAYNGAEDERTFWAYSFYKTGGFNNAPLGDDRFASDIGDSGGYSFSSRSTHLLQYDEGVDDRYLWHIGSSQQIGTITANTAAGNPTNQAFYQARTAPEFGPLGYPDINTPFGQAFGSNPIYVDTGRFAANAFGMLGLETVYQAGPLGITSEFIGTFVDSAAGMVFYHGAYVQAAYRLTGENRKYDKQSGALTKLVPYEDFFSLRRGRRGIHGRGAWEVAFRWSYVDLRDPTKLNGYYLPGSSSVGAGLLNDTTFGLTWFLNQHTKLQFNWIHAMLDNTAKGHSTGDLFVTRLQMDF
jgi:phosphate-selective porin OprO/OprP